MSAAHNNTPETNESQYAGNVGERLRTALKAFGYWPSELMWTPESIKAWLAEEIEMLNPLHLQVTMQVVTGLRVLELAEHAEYVEEVLRDLEEVGDEEEE